MKPWLALAVLTSAAWGQDKQALHARELFYTPPPDTKTQAQTPPVQTPPVQAQVEKAQPAKPPVKKAAVRKVTPVEQASQKPPEAPQAVPLGLRYSVMKRSAAGRFEEIDPDTTFHSGDRIRLEVAANTSGYLYVVMQGSSGSWSLLSPTPEVAAGSNLIQRGESRQIPPGDRGQFFFDEQAGVEKLFLVLSRQPESDLDKLIYSVGGSPGSPAPSRTLMAKATVNDDVVARLRQEMASRDLVFEKVEGGGGAVKAENAAYVVNPSSAPDARLVVDVKLTHK
jgi:hypothetical protein